MKKIVVFSGLAIAIVSIWAFTDTSIVEEKTPPSNYINWMNWTEMMAASKSVKKPILIDVYTSWCGWCKHMDRTTFKNRKVVSYINKNYYAVKLNAETTKKYKFKGHTFKYVTQGRKGIHELAYSLLEGKLSYPSMVYLNKDFKRIMISPGYKKTKGMLLELKYAAENIYERQTWEDYLKANE